MSSWVVLAPLHELANVLLHIRLSVLVGQPLVARKLHINKNSWVVLAPLHELANVLLNIRLSVLVGHPLVARKIHIIK